MPWYPVIKRIKGRSYLYMQTTYRESGKVKTKNRYIGPAGDGIPFSHEPRPTDGISSDLEQARVTRDVLRDTLENHPAKFFIPLRGDLNKQSIGGDTFAELNYQAMKKPRPGKRQETLRHLDRYLSEHGFADFEELDASVEEYFRLKEQHEAAAQSYARLKQERADAWKYHVAVGMSRTPESVIRTIPEPKQPKPPKAPIVKMRAVPVPEPKPFAPLKIREPGAPLRYSLKNTDHARIRLAKIRRFKRAPKLRDAYMRASLKRIKDDIRRADRLANSESTRARDPRDIELKKFYRRRLRRQKYLKDK